MKLIYLKTNKTLKDLRRIGRSVIALRQILGIFYTQISGNNEITP